jgi:arylamine N-acetyltransferase
VLGPISMEEGDAEGAHQILSNSFEAGRSIFDTPAMIRALGNMQPLLLASGQVQQAQQNHDYAARKAAEVNQSAHAAAAAPGHRFILTYAASLSSQEQQQ